MRRLLPRLCLAACLAASSHGQTTIKVGDGILGRVLNGLGEPIDGKPLPPGLMEWSVDRDCPDPFTRRRVERPLPLGLQLELLREFLRVWGHQQV